MVNLLCKWLIYLKNCFSHCFNCLHWLTGIICHPKMADFVIVRKANYMTFENIRPKIIPASNISYADTCITSDKHSLSSKKVRKLV